MAHPVLVTSATSLVGFGVFAEALTGGYDQEAQVWDQRSKNQHNLLVSALLMPRVKLIVTSVLNHTQPSSNTRPSYYSEV
jgi:hypothetical protein